MFVRKTTIEDIDRVMEIYAHAREMMIENGNPMQWGMVHPPLRLIKNDIREGMSYVCCDENGVVLAVFYLAKGPDSTYEKIDGAWLNDEAYGVVHRIARAGDGAAGSGAFCLEWCSQQFPNIRIDTHADNVPMRKLLERLGYVYCGIIRIENGDERLAYQKGS